jgi:hypothetical protein
MEPTFLSDHLADLRADLDRGAPIRRDTVDMMIDMALSMELSIDHIPTERPNDPPTSTWEGTFEDMTNCQRDVYLTFQMFGTMDAVELEKNYNAARLIYPELFSAKKWTGNSLRGRQARLTYKGALVLVDENGVSPTGQKAERHRINTEL